MSNVDSMCTPWNDYLKLKSLMDDELPSLLELPYVQYCSGLFMT